MGRSGSKQRKVLGVSETKGRNTLGWLLLLLVSGGLTIGAIANGESIGLLFAGAALLALIQIMSRLDRNAHARKVERASRAPRPATGAGARSAPNRAAPRPPATSRAADPPRLDVRFLEPKEFPVVRKQRNVKRTRNVIGLAPVDIAYLRMFDNDARVRTFLESAWREFGRVHLLRSARSVTKKEFPKNRRARDGFFVGDDAGLAARIDRAAQDGPLRPGRHTLSGVGAADVKVRDQSGSYPYCAIPCRDDYWQRAVDLLLARAGLVVLDLSGVTKRNTGTVYELQRVVDVVPIERVALLCDPKSDRRFLRSLVQSSWSRMPRSSPNASGKRREVRCAVTDRFKTVAMARPDGGGYGGYDELRSDRKGSQRVAAAAHRAAVGSSR